MGSPPGHPERKAALLIQIFSSVRLMPDFVLHHNIVTWVAVTIMFGLPCYIIARSQYTWFWKEGERPCRKAELQRTEGMVWQSLPC